MNILGITGSIGWDGNIEQWLCDWSDFRVHDSGATLIMNGELKTAIQEERFSRNKHEGNYPIRSIQTILDHNKLTKNDIDLVVYVFGANTIGWHLKRVGYIENKLQGEFPNCKVEFLSHHVAHSAATFYTSGFEEANILSFDGAGDYELSEDERWLVPHMKFSQGKGLTLTEIASEYCNVSPMPTGFGCLYNSYSLMIYKSKMNIPDTDLVVDNLTYPGKIMGLAAFGDYHKINLPEWFSLEREDGFPQLHNCSTDYTAPSSGSWNPDDLAAWVQHQFEKYLLLFLSNIPEHEKRDNLCLGGGCALNIIANTKILEEGIYKNVHVNTAPNDDGLHFGAALYKAAEYENKLILPDDIGYLGVSYTDEDIEAALC